MSSPIFRRTVLKQSLCGGTLAAFASLGARAVANAAAVDEPPAEGDEGGEKRELGKVRQLVPGVPSVRLALLRDEPSNVGVTVKGEVPTGGWTDVVLVRAHYDEPPADGIVDYFFLATAPEGIAAQVVTPVSATHNWKSYEKDAPWLKGVRVHGAKGSVVKRLDRKGG